MRPAATVKRLSPSCTEVLQTAAGGADCRYLYISDLHLDNPKCDRNLLRRHLDEAVTEGALIFVFGDLFCAMQGKGDPRGTKADVMEPHKRTYWNALLNDAFTFLLPYAENLAVISDGNHETSVIKHREIDLLEILAERLRAEGSPVQHMPYQGWIKHRYMKTKKENGSCGSSVLTHFDHGNGGGGPVTRNMIETNRRLARIENADVYVYAHVHEIWQLRSQRERITAQGKMEFADQLHVQLATYKQEYGPNSGFHMQRGAPPKPLGGWWIRHRLKVSAGARRWHVTAEETF